MSLSLLVAGFVIMGIGIVVMFLPPPAPNPQRMQAQGLPAELGPLLDRFDKRYRPGIALLFVGLAVTSMGVFLEAEKAKEANKEKTAISATAATNVV